MRHVAATLTLALASLWSAEAEYIYPVPLNDAGLGMEFVYPDDAWKTAAPYRSVGMVMAKFSNGEEFFGSGAVAKDPRLLFSCAHVAYDRGRWASRISFARAYSRQADPSDADFVHARGFRKLAGYAPRYTDPKFDYDFTVAFFAAGFGDALSCHPSAKAALSATGTPKTILGYPSTLDHYEALGEYVPGFAYPHRTGPFEKGFYQEYPLTGSYLGVDGVTTGPGNSGGPVLVEQNGEHLLAGILVSGSYDSAGVFALNAESDLAVQSALGAADSATTRTVTHGRTVPLKDGSVTYREVRFNFSSMPAQTSKVLFSWTVTAANAQDLDAMLRSPDGITVSLPKQAVVSGLDLSSELAGLKANGIWTLYVRDSVPGGRSALRRASVSLSSRQP